MTCVDYWPPVWCGGLFSYIFSFLLDFHARPSKLSKQTFNLFWSLLFWLLYVIFVIIYKKKRFFFQFHPPSIFSSVRLSPHFFYYYLFYFR
jgi:hypothetical protein